MDLAAGPAALGGIIACVGLCAWLLGRLHGGIVARNQHCAPVPVAAAPPLAPAAHPPFEWGAADPVPAGALAGQTGRGLAVDPAAALSKLHDEVTAYRREQQVLTGANAEDLWSSAAGAVLAAEYRNLGLIGQPAGPALARAGDAPAAFALVRYRSDTGCVVQPSLPVAAGARV